MGERVALFSYFFMVLESGRVDSLRYFSGEGGGVRLLEKRMIFEYI